MGQMLQNIKKPSFDTFFSNLSHTNRLAIMTLLSQENLKTSQIANKMNTSIQSIQRHLDKLVQSGLITRDGSGITSLTPLGEAIMLQVPSFEFLYNNKEFFQTHSLSYLPQEFVERIGEIGNFKVVSGYVSTVEACKKICENAEKFGKFLVTQVSLDVYETHFPKLRDKNLMIRYIMGENAIVPKGWRKSTKMIGEDKMIQNGTLERKLIKRMPVEMLVTDNSAFFAFPDNSGTADLSTMFVSGDERFRKWCDDLFEYYWGKSSSFVESKIREV